MIPTTANVGHARIVREEWEDALAALAEMEAERDALRETVRRLNRRAQVLEAGIAEKIASHPPGSLGRALANAAAETYHSRAQVAERERDALRQRIAALEAERERHEPVAWQIRNEKSESWAFVGNKEADADWYMKVFEGPFLKRPLYAHPLAIREPTDEECERICRLYAAWMPPTVEVVADGRAMFNAVREVMK
jgi:hypothetical protein